MVSFVSRHKTSLTFPVRIQFNMRTCYYRPIFISILCFAANSYYNGTNAIISSYPAQSVAQGFFSFQILSLPNQWLTVSCETSLGSVLFGFQYSLMSRFYAPLLFAVKYYLHWSKREGSACSHSVHTKLTLYQQHELINTNCSSI